MFKSNNRGFTLLELLLVIAILSVIATIAIQEYSVSERQAKEQVGSYNKVNTEKILSNFKSLHGVYPTGFHTGLSSAAGGASVPGLSQEAALNMAGGGTAGGSVGAGSVSNGYSQGCTVTTPSSSVVKALTASQVRALRDNGIHTLSTGGYTAAGVSGAQTPLSASTPKCWVLSGGKDLYRGGSLQFDGSGTVGNEVVSINGRTLSSWQFGEECVVLVFITGDVYWDAALKGNPDDTGYGTVDTKSMFSLPHAPKDSKAAAETNFPYYIAAFYLAPSQIGSKIGYSAKLLGILDSDLKAIN